MWILLTGEMEPSVPKGKFICSHFCVSISITAIWSVFFVTTGQPHSTSPSWMLREEPWCVWICSNPELQSWALASWYQWSPPPTNHSSLTACWMKGRQVWCLRDPGAESPWGGGAVALYLHPHPGFLRWHWISSVLLRYYSFVNMCQYWKCFVSERATRITKAVVYCCRNKIEHSRIFSQHQSSF